jgi:hypothetical protein
LDLGPQRRFVLRVGQNSFVSPENFVGGPNALPDTNEGCTGIVVRLDGLEVFIRRRKVAALVVPQTRRLHMTDAREVTFRVVRGIGVIVCGDRDGAAVGKVACVAGYSALRHVRFD